MAKIQAVWAIDIGQAALKALKLVPGEDPDKLFAEAFDFIEFDKILSQPDADPEELVRNALTTFLGRNDVRGAKVALGVSGQAGLVKFIKLPPVEKKRIPDIVNFEVRQHIPFSLDEVIWDYQQIAGDGEGDDEEFTMAEVGLFAMKRDQVHRAILPLKNAGIEVDLVQMGPIALYNFATFDQPANRTGEAGSDKSGISTVYIDIGADNTDLIITDGVRIWQRNVPIGGNHFTRALTKELKLTFSKAEHLKKNATKAPDPRAVFTAMRGIFNDFSSEVSRSIGFYSSVNRQAKIDRVVGLGNGFKLPGLQKFLQQNLNHEVERLESFNRLTNDEVTQAPQFVENLPSFAIAYGLGIQGLGRGQLRTNLLPAEIEQTRLIRKKKPWALAASALLLLGFTSLFFSDWAAWAKARSPEFTSAVDRANGVSTNGKNLQSGFDTAKKSFEDVKARGEALVGESTDTTDWPFLLQVVTRVLPKPAQELGVEGDDPRAIPILEQLRVHVDEVIPVWREDVATWFNDELTADDKQSMHPLDRESAPSGPGWVIQVIGHHYNPSPLLRRDVSEKSKQTLEKMKEMNLALGPLRYLVEQVLPRFWPAELRLLGINHAALTFFDSDTEWMKEKGDAGLPVALRSREVSAGDGTTEGTSAGGGLMGAMAARGGQGAMGMDDMQGMMKSSMGGGSMGAMMSSRGGRGGMLGVGGTPTKEKLSTLMRTKFRIEFVWQPVDPKAAPAKSVEDVRKEMADAFAKSGKGAIQALDEAKLIAAAKEAVKKKVLELKSQAQQVPGAVTAPSLPAAPATAPQTPAAPQPPTPPGAPAAKNQS